MSRKFIYLIRHGQHDHDAPTGDELGGILTDLGQLQAKKTGERLSGLPVDVIHFSSMRRAAETAQIIAQFFPGVVMRPTRQLWEGIPSVPAQDAQHYVSFPQDELEQDHIRIERAFARFFTRPRKKDSHEIIVAHGNVLRYFMICSLQAPSDLWDNLHSNNCGLSVVIISSNGRMEVASHNDTGHLAGGLVT